MVANNINLSLTTYLPFLFYKYPGLFFHSINKQKHGLRLKGLKVCLLVESALSLYS